MSDNKRQIERDCDKMKLSYPDRFDQTGTLECPECHKDTAFNNGFSVCCGARLLPLLDYDAVETMSKRVGMTPGLWSVGEANRNEEIQVLGGPGNRLVCVCCHECVTGLIPEMEANAQAIAALPDLVEALQALYQDTADYIKLNNLGDVHHNQSMKLAAAALKKAGVL